MRAVNTASGSSALAFPVGRARAPVRWPWRLLGVLAALCGGAVLALLSHHLWNLDTQYVVVIVAAVALTAFSMLFLPRFSDFLLVSLMLSLPLASFTKSFFFVNWAHDARAKATMRFSGIVAVSLPDILLLGLYGMWFVNIFMLRRAPLPRLARHDLFPFLLIAACLLSMPGSVTPKAALFGTFFTLQHVALYFYLSRHIERRHLPWIAAAFAVAILGETLLGAFQYLTGKWLSLAWARGVGENLNSQYVVPGIEHVKRATGTTFDSHAFGAYLAMLAPLPFVLTFAGGAGARPRLRWGAVFLAACIAIVLSFSRSAWISAAVALTFVWFTHLAWGERGVLAPTAMFALLLLALSPWYGPLIYRRFFETDSSLLTARFDQFPVAWAMWKDHFFFGYGVGNYMDGLKRYNQPGVLELPVHNMLLWVGAEAGLFGVIAFFGVLFGAFGRAWRVLRARREPYARYALAVCAALLAYLVDGLTDPLFREPTVYTMVWVLVALSVALARLDAPLTGRRAESAPVMATPVGARVAGSAR